MLPVQRVATKLGDRLEIICKVAPVDNELQSEFCSDVRPK